MTFFIGLVFLCRTQADSVPIVSRRHQTTQTSRPESYMIADVQCRQLSNHLSSVTKGSDRNSHISIICTFPVITDKTILNILSAAVTQTRISFRPALQLFLMTHHTKSGVWTNSQTFNLHYHLD